MAQRTVIILTDDLTNEESDSVQTTTFGLDGTSYEIDLNEENYQAMHDAFAKYVEAARKVSNRSGVTAENRRVSGAGRSSASREDAKAAREWAVSNGLMKSDSRGRIPVKITEAYEARDTSRGAELLATLKGEVPGQVTIPEEVGQPAESAAEPVKAAPKGRGKAKATEGDSKGLTVVAS